MSMYQPRAFLYRGCPLQPEGERNFEKHNSTIQIERFLRIPEMNVKQNGNMRHDNTLQK